MPLTRVLTHGSLTSGLISSMNLIKPGRATRLTGRISATISFVQLSNVEASVCAGLSGFDFTKESIGPIVLPPEAVLSFFETWPTIFVSIVGCLFLMWVRIFDADRVVQLIPLPLLLPQPAMVHLIRNWEKIKLVNEDGNVNGNEDIWICLIRIDMWLKLYDLQVQRCDISKACGGYNAVWIYESELFF